MSHEEHREPRTALARGETQALARPLDIERAREFLAKCNDIPRIKQIRDQADAMARYLRAQKAGDNAAARASVIAREADVRAGELLRAMDLERKGAGRRAKLGSNGTPISPLAALGLTRGESKCMQAAASVPAAVRKALFDKAIEDNRPVAASALVRIARQRNRDKKRRSDVVKVKAAAPFASLPSGTFATVVIDPPWDWGDEGDADQFGRARPAYATMPIAEVAALDIARVAAKDAHLYLWITNRSLPKGFALLEAWGFRYVTCLTWAKPSFGMGNYFRGQTEHVLFGVRGSLSLRRQDAGTLLCAPRGKQGHSSKPDEFFALVESCSDGPRLEMFGRGEREGWTVWGT